MSPIASPLLGGKGLLGLPAGCGDGQALRFDETLPGLSAPTSQAAHAFQLLSTAAEAQSTEWASGSSTICWAPWRGLAP